MARKTIGYNIKKVIKREIDRINADGEFDLINLSDGEYEYTLIIKTINPIEYLLNR